MHASNRTLHCPLCGRAAVWTDNPSRPFCSERCRLADLEGWLKGRYVIPGDPEESETSSPESESAHDPTPPQAAEKT